MPLPDDNPPPHSSDLEPEPPRREFLKKTACTLVGGGIVAAPLAAGIAVFTDPLRRGPAAGGWTRITALEAVPADGRPKKFQVIADRLDAWNRYPSVPIGFIYLRRTGENDVAAFNASCPHAGCAVDFRDGDNSFFCPCHRSHFAADGAVVQPSPAARGLDELDVQLRDGAIWVRFQNFRAGIGEKLPLA
ncbi:MAG TPA: Rieske 2Fe-2S domain-containing protein [Verrucomicrobiales bacterium]|nr:Rieske 2Fe-2S domain-containing protein [Verrucomicrobiales bacterium]